MATPSSMKIADDTGESFSVIYTCSGDGIYYLDSSLELTLCSSSPTPGFTTDRVDISCPSGSNLVGVGLDVGGQFFLLDIASGLSKSRNPLYCEDNTLVEIDGDQLTVQGSSCLDSSGLETTIPPLSNLGNYSNPCEAMYSYYQFYL